MQAIAETQGGEVTPEQIWDCFAERVPRAPARSRSSATAPSRRATAARRSRSKLRLNGGERTIAGRGNGPIDVLRRRARARSGSTCACSTTTSTPSRPARTPRAAAYVEAAVGDRVLWGVGIHPSIVTASLRAVASAVNRAAVQGLVEVPSAALSSRID